MKLTKYASVALLAMMIFPSAGYAIYSPDRPVSNNPDEVSITSVEDGDDIEYAEDTVRITGQEKAAEKKANAKSRGDERKSTVAKAVQEILATADSMEGGIGQQVRLVAQEQNQAEERIAESLNKVDGRSKGIKFLLGPDWKELKGAKSEINENSVRIAKLKRIASDVEDEEARAAIEAQIRVLEIQNQTLEENLNDATKGFSLLGWLFKIVHGA